MPDILETDVPLSQSLIWRLQRKFYEQRGLKVWTEDRVPEYITNNPFIAEIYSRIVFNFLSECMIAAKKESRLLTKDHPLRILELGAGHGKFCFLFLSQLSPLLRDRGIPEETVRYCMTDCSEASIESWRANKFLAKFVDAGMLELRASQANGFGQPSHVESDGLRVKIPPAHSRALHWMVHDLLKEGDYWRGRIDLRHLHDLALLAESDHLDWRALQAAMSDRGARNALDTQLLALHHFFGIRIPTGCAQRPMVRFQHWRRVFTARHPFLGAPLRLAGNLAWGAWRFSHADSLARRGPLDLGCRVVRTLFYSRAKI